MTQLDILARGLDSGDEFSQVIAVCEKHGDYCLIGGHGVNAYSYPIYTADMDLVVSADRLEAVAADLTGLGFNRRDHEYTVNFKKPGSHLFVQFTKVELYKDFYKKAVTKQVFGIPVKVAAVEDIIVGKVAAWKDSTRRASKKLKDASDLARLLENHPLLERLFPQEIVDLVKPQVELQHNPPKQQGLARQAMENFTARAVDGQERDDTARSL